MRAKRSWGVTVALAMAGSLTVLLAAAAAPLAAAGHQNPVTTTTGLLAVTLPFAAVGLFVAWRQPRNPVGWLMLCFGLGFLLSIGAGSYDLADYRFGRGLPLGPASLLLYLVWEPALVLVPVAVLLFPRAGCRQRGGAGRLLSAGLAYEVPGHSGRAIAGAK